MAEDPRLGDRLVAGNRGLQVSSDARSGHLDAIRASLEPGDTPTSSLQRGRRPTSVAIGTFALLVVVGLGTAIAMVGRGHGDSGDATVQAGVSTTGSVSPTISQMPTEDAVGAEPTSSEQRSNHVETSIASPDSTRAGAAPGTDASSSTTATTISTSIEPRASTKTVANPTTIPPTTAASAATSTSTSTSTTTMAGLSSVLYLLDRGGGDTTSSATLPLSISPPVRGSLPNFDTDRDGAAGLLVQKDGAGLSTGDLTKRQDWMFVFSDPTTLRGPTKLTLWLAAKDYKNETIGIRVALDLCSPTCERLGVGEWSGSGRSTYQSATVALGHLDVLAAPGSTLRLRVVAPDALGTTDLWLAYDTTSYPSRLQTD